MNQSRINDALKMALNATSAAPDDRYTAAMIRRARAILGRAAESLDPATTLPMNEQDLSCAIRQRQSDLPDIATLRRYTIAKLKVSNPDYLQNG